jgi:hypothetical protein
LAILRIAEELQTNDKDGIEATQALCLQNLNQYNNPPILLFVPLLAGLSRD